MAQSLIACPLCSTASFSNSSTLCLSLVNVASKWIRCTMCDEELRGLDKFTIHLLSHLIHTPSFKRFLINSGQLSDTPLCFNSQPLNLVKSHNGQKDDHSLLQTLPVDIDQQSIQKESKCERPSLKIDDEVMIFFNDNSLNENLETNKNETAVVKALDEVKPSSSGLPKFTINFNMENRNQHENISDSEKKGVIPNKNYKEANSRNDSIQYIYPMGTNVQGSSNEDVLVQNHELQMEFNDGNKVKDIHISLPVTENILDMATDSSCATTQTESQLGNKSSYLSPKGERVLGYRCDICSLVFPDEHILTMHRQLIHIELNKGKSEPMSYKCHLCSKSFVMKGSLMVHMRVAHFGGAVVARLVEAKQLETDAVSPDLAQFICSVCNKGFQKEQQLAQHEKLHDGKQCDVCLKTFTTKYFLRKHKRLHTGEMPYQCGQCNKSFTFQQSYHKHLLYHSDDKPYTCSDCGRAFKELSTLHNHQRIHTGEKPFSCETCGKCFRQRVSYLVHRRIHTGAMPYQCQECGKTFRYKVSERTHKCSTSTTNGSNEIPNPQLPDTKEETILTPESEQKETQDTVMTNEPVHAEVEPESMQMFPEPTDFFSLVMSPSNRLQHLSLTSDGVDNASSPTSRESIDSEALKQLLYDVADYT